MCLKACWAPRALPGTPSWPVCRQACLHGSNVPRDSPLTTDPTATDPESRPAYPKPYTLYATLLRPFDSTIRRRRQSHLPENGHQTINDSLLISMPQQGTHGPASSIKQVCEARPDGLKRWALENKMPLIPQGRPATICLLLRIGKRLLSQRKKFQSFKSCSTNGLRHACFGIWKLGQAA